MILQRGGLIKFPEQKHIELLASPDRLPKNPTIYDEEFDDPYVDAISGLPTKLNLGTVLYSTYDYNKTIPSNLYIKHDHTAAGQMGYTMSIPTDDSCSITACGQSFNRISGDAWRIDICDATPTLGINMACRTSGAIEYIMAYQRTSGSLYAVGTNFETYRAGKLYMHLQKVGSACTWWWSIDGLSWRRHYTMTKAFTPASIIFISSAAASSGSYSTFALDWIRYNWITLP